MERAKTKKAHGKRKRVETSARFGRSVKARELLARLRPLDPDVLRDARDWLRLSQDELAERLGTDQQSVSRWETGLRMPSKSFREKYIRLIEKELSK